MEQRWWLGAGAFALVCAGMGYLAGYAGASAHFKTVFASFMPVPQSDSSYPLVAPLLAYRTPEATELGEYTALQNSIQQDINQASDVGKVSVYFRDLNTSAWVGINQNDDYYPASLLKVPVMIAYYKEAEADPAILDQSVVYQGVSQASSFDAPSNLTVGQTYTVEQLIEQMIINSDNGATLTLLARIDPTTLSSVYDDLGITNPGNDSSTYQISDRTYALFFRVLYNATYLDSEYSEKALELLSQATFADGLAAGVPSDMRVAHKFGEHVLTSSDGTTATGVELSDCGVVYYPSHPYLLCVMTSAPDLASSESIIKNISATTYAAIATEYALPAQAGTSTKP